VYPFLAQKFKKGGDCEPYEYTHKPSFTNQILHLTNLHLHSANYPVAANAIPLTSFFHHSFYFMKPGFSAGNRITGNTILAVQPGAVTTSPLMALPQSGGFEIVPLCEILYCEASGNYTYYFIADRKLIVSRTLKESEMLLRNYGFIRIHQSYLVNLAHVRRYVKSAGGSVILSNRMELTVSPKRREALMNALIHL
jgi:DNA-binding LytR/AlgR family response regulator